MVASTRRLVDQHLLEAALQRGVLLDVLAVLVERGRADAVQLAARQRGLEHVAGVDRAFGLAGADHGVQLVDEEDDRPSSWPDFLQHGLQALLELAAVLGAGQQRRPCRATARACPSATRAPRRRRCAAPGLRRWRSCRRRARRSAPGCSWCGAAAPGWRGGSRRRGRSPGRACPGGRARSGRACTSSAPRAGLRPRRESTFWPPRTASIAASSALRVRPWPRTMPPRSVLLSASASRNISLAMNWSPRLLASFSAACSSVHQVAPGLHLLPPPCTCGRPSIAAVHRGLQRRRRWRRRAPAAPSGRRPGASMAASRCAGSM